MALDFIAWAPEIQFLVVMLGLLYYGTGPAVAPVTEALWIPSGWTQSKSQGPKLDKPSAGPDYIPSHLTSWAIVTCLLTAWLIWDSPLPVLQAGGAFIRDPFTQMMGGFLMVFASACLAAANGWLRKAHVIHPEYIVLILLAILGQHLLIMTSDLMALYLCLELQSFALVVLCSLNYTSPYAIEAGMKYFLLSAFSSCLLLLGIGLIYWETGLTRCSHIQELLSADLEPNLTLWLGLWLVGVGLLWKLAAAPLHMWAADVYQGAWTSVTLLISTLPKISVLAFWVHSWHALWTTAFGEAMAIFSALSLIVGALAPMAQSQLKRLLAFSSISHMGFLLIPLVQGTEGLSALWAYLILYLLTNLALWGLMLWPFARGKFTTSGPQSIWDLAGLNAYMPVAATAWAGGMLSLAGLPPVAGFLGKLGIFWWGLNQHQYALMTLALVATLLSTVYYLRVLKVAYVDQPKAWGQFESMAPLNAYLIAMAWFSLAILLWHGTPLVLASHLMALACSFFSFRMVIKLQAQWIVGFVDAEGCFTVYVRIAADGQTPLYLRPAFLVTQHNRNTQLLYALKAHFGCGQVYNQGKNAAEWKVQKLEHLLTKVIPFFEKHALKTQKNIEFRRFRDICLLMRDKVHRNPEGLQKCVVLARNLRVKRETQAEVPVILDDQPETV